MRVGRWISMVTAFAFLCVGCGAQAQPVPGYQAPNFSLPALSSGKQVSLKELLGKTPVILNAWASWCHPCNLETPDLVRLASLYKGKVTVIGVDMTTNDTLQDAKAFVAKYHIPYPVLADPKGDFLNTYRIQGFPTTFVLDASGKVKQVFPGMLTKSRMEKLFQRLAYTNSL